MAAPAAGVLFGIAASIATALTPGLHSATYRDARGEGAKAPDITRVVVSDDRSTLTFDVWIANRPELASDMGLQIVIDADRRQATGNQMLVYGLGAEYLIQMLDGTLKLLRWDGRAGRWQPAASQPSWSYASGRATIRLGAAAVRNPYDFVFEVSTASGLIPEEEGTIDITNAHFDFAPNVGRGGWRYRHSRLR